MMIYFVKDGYHWTLNSSHVFHLNIAQSFYSDDYTLEWAIAFNGKYV